jgi:hypothetical protein
MKNVNDAIPSKKSDSEEPLPVPRRAVAEEGATKTPAEPAPKKKADAPEKKAVADGDGRKKNANADDTDARKKGRAEGERGQCGGRVHEKGGR